MNDETTTPTADDIFKGSRSDLRLAMQFASKAVYRMSEGPVFADDIDAARASLRNALDFLNDYRFGRKEEG